MPTKRNSQRVVRAVSKGDQVLALAHEQGMLRPRDLAIHGIPREHLSRLLKRGQLERIGRGIYRLPGMDVSQYHTLVQVAKRYPGAVICLLSALRFHNLTAQAPGQIWIAIDPKARHPQSSGLPLRIVRFSGSALEAGIEKHVLEGVPVRVTTPARTVADCFKYRNKIGLDVALEALREGRRDRRFTLDELWEMAHVCRVTNVLRPYLEAIV